MSAIVTWLAFAAVLAFIAMFFGIVALGTVALSAMGLDLVTALSAT